MAGKESSALLGAVASAKKAGAKSALWKAVAAELGAPARKRAEINLSRLCLVAKEGSTAVVPGKVLGAGSVGHRLNVAALSYSASARKLIEKAGGKCMSIPALASSNPKGTNILLVK